MPSRRWYRIGRKGEGVWPRVRSGGSGPHSRGGSTGRASGGGGRGDRRAMSAHTVLLIGKSTLAATIAWVISYYLLHAQSPAFAPFSAVLIMQVTVYQSLLQSSRYVGAVVAGVAVQAALGFLVGPGLLTFVLVALVALAIGRWPALGVAGLPGGHRGVLRLLHLRLRHLGPGEGHPARADHPAGPHRLRHRHPRERRRGAAACATAAPNTASAPSPTPCATWSATCIRCCAKANSTRSAPSSGGTRAGQTEELITQARTGLRTAPGRASTTTRAGSFAATAGTPASRGTARCWKRWNARCTRWPPSPGASTSGSEDGDQPPLPRPSSDATPTSWSPSPEITQVLGTLDEDDLHDQAQQLCRLADQAQQLPPPGDRTGRAGRSAARRPGPPVRGAGHRGHPADGGVPAHLRRAPAPRRPGRPGRPREIRETRETRRPRRPRRTGTTGGEQD